MLKPYFESETGTSLAIGMKISVNVQIQYHELYGMSLNIIDIDPSFTVSEIELQRKRTIKKLIEDGIFEMNRSLEMPLLPLRIAVISSPTAAGFQDFMNQLYGNENNYNFSTKLFAAIMQGKEAENSIIAAIDEVFKSIENFDVLAIIRGGGSISDLACFDSYNLASCVAQIPIPVITGIGHDKDVSVVDMIANTMMKTPTAAAEFLVDCIARQDFYLNDIAESLSDIVGKQLQNKNYELQNIAVELKNSANSKVERNKIYVESIISQRIKPLLAARFRESAMKLDLYRKEIESGNPKRILQRGYSVVMHNGQAITDEKLVKPNDEVEIIMYKGRKKATIK
jgi:exodeoxyribonuclease VII large subunit